MKVMRVSDKRYAELMEIAARISLMDPEDIRMESAVWMEKQGCRSTLEICIVRNAVLGQLVYERGETHARGEMGSK